MLRLPTALVLALTASARPALQAQEPADTLPFRAHQWAFLFTGGSLFSGIGAAHFTAPNRAWVFNVGGSISHEHSDLPFAPDTTEEIGQTITYLTLTLGRRFYQAVRPSVVTYQTLTAIGGVSHSSQTSSIAGPTGTSTFWNAGVGFDLGAQYLITSRLSIGGQFGAQLNFQSGRSGGQTEPSAHSWLVAFSFGQISFGGAIYF